MAIECHIMYGGKIIKEWGLYNRAMIPIAGDILEFEDAEMIRKFRVVERRWQVHLGCLECIDCMVVLFSEAIKARV